MSPWQALVLSRALGLGCPGGMLQEVGPRQVVEASRQALAQGKPHFLLGSARGPFRWADAGRVMPGQLPHLIAKDTG